MDLELKETGNGGDLIKNTKDLSVIEGFENMPYLAMFGGNVKSDTPLQRPEGEQAFDFWGNSLLMANDSSIQFNSKTERTLNQVALNSFGRTKIEEAVKSDLAFMKPFANIKVAVSIISTNMVAIGVQIVKPDNIQQQQYVYIWDKTNSELIDREFVIIKGVSVPTSGIFDESFDDSFD
jgi:phage gp46-like protein